MKKLVAMGFLGMMLSTGAFAAPLYLGGTVTPNGKCDIGSLSTLYDVDRYHTTWTPLADRDGIERCLVVISKNGSAKEANVQDLSERIRVLEEMLGVETPIHYIENSDSELRDDEMIDKGWGEKGFIHF